MIRREYLQSMKSAFLLAATGIVVIARSALAGDFMYSALGLLPIAASAYVFISGKKVKAAQEKDVEKEYRHLKSLGWTQ